MRQKVITTAQTFLNKNKIPYKSYEYNCTVDHDLLLFHEKTFVTAITPVDGMISLKNAARIMGLKSLELASASDAQRITGFVIGGVSPFGQKRRTLTLLCSSALNYDEILVSGGRRGFSVGVNPNDIIKALDAKVGDFIDHKNT